jgi:hypothetical protein
MAVGDALTGADVVVLAVPGSAVAEVVAARRQELADWLSGIPVLPGDEPVLPSGGAPVRRSHPARTA